MVAQKPPELPAALGLGRGSGCSQEPVPQARAALSPPAWSWQIPECPWLVLKEQEDGQSLWSQGQRALWPGYLQLDTDASWSPSDTVTWLGSNAGRQLRIRALPGPDDTTWSEPCSPVLNTRPWTPAQRHTWVPPRGSRPGKTSDRLRIYPKETKSLKRLVKPEEAQMPLICKFRFFYPPIFPPPMR